MENTTRYSLHEESVEELQESVEELKEKVCNEKTMFISNLSKAIEGVLYGIKEVKYFNLKDKSLEIVRISYYYGDTAYINVNGTSCLYILDAVTEMIRTGETWGLVTEPGNASWIASKIEKLEKGETDYIKSLRNISKKSWEVTKQQLAQSFLEEIGKEFRKDSEAKDLVLKTMYCIGYEVGVLESMQATQRTEEK